MWGYWLYIAGFSVIILVLAVVFVRYVMRRLDSVEGSPASDRREEKIFRLYSEIESMMDSFEEYVGEVHEELERERAELAELSRRASSLYMQAEDRVLNLSEYTQGNEPSGGAPRRSAAPESPLAPGGRMSGAPGQENSGNKRESRLSSRDRSTLSGLKTKSQKVRFLMSRGLSLEEVARELGIGKGEVKLIADLEK